MSSFIKQFDAEAVNKIPLVKKPQEGKYYYYTGWETWEEVRNLADERFLNYNKFTYAGKYLREVEHGGLRWAAFQNYEVSNKEVLIELSKTAFYEISEYEYVTLKRAKKVEVVVNAQENRYYFATHFTELVDKDTKRERYYTIHDPIQYLGKHTGMRSEGWGKDMKEWSHFIRDGEEVVIEHTETTAFYHAEFYAATGGELSQAQ